MRRYRALQRHDAWLESLRDINPAANGLQLGPGGDMRVSRLYRRRLRPDSDFASSAAAAHTAIGLHAQRTLNTPPIDDAREYCNTSAWLCGLFGFSSLEDLTLLHSLAALHAIAIGCSWLYGAGLWLAATVPDLLDLHPQLLVPAAAPLVFVWSVLRLISVVNACTAEHRNHHCSLRFYWPDLSYFHPPPAVRMLCCVLLAPLSLLCASCPAATCHPCSAIESALHFLGFAPTEFDVAPTTRPCTNAI